MLLQKLDGLADDITAATSSRRRAAGLNAHNARVAGGDEIFDAQFFAVKLHRLQSVDDGRDQALGEREGGIVLRVAADLQDAPPELCERDGEIGRGGALSNAALAIDREHLGRADRNVRIEINLARTRRLRISNWKVHAAIPGVTP